METGTAKVSFFSMFVRADRPEWNLRDEGERADLKIDVTFPDMSTSCSWAAVAIWLASWASGEALSTLVQMIVARARRSEVHFHFREGSRELLTSSKTDEELTQDVLDILREAQGQHEIASPE